MAASERFAAMNSPSDLSYSRPAPAGAKGSDNESTQRCQQDNAPNHFQPKFQITKPDQVVRRHSAHGFTRCRAAGHHVGPTAAATESIRFWLPGACSTWAEPRE